MKKILAILFVLGIAALALAGTYDLKSSSVATTSQTTYSDVADLKNVSALGFKFKLNTIDTIRVDSVVCDVVTGEDPSPANMKKIRNIKTALSDTVTVYKFFPADSFIVYGFSRYAALKMWWGDASASADKESVTVTADNYGYLEWTKSTGGTNFGLLDEAWSSPNYADYISSAVAGYRVCMSFADPAAVEVISNIVIRLRATCVGCTGGVHDHLSIGTVVYDTSTHDTTGCTGGFGASMSVTADTSIVDLTVPADVFSGVTSLDSINVILTSAVVEAETSIRVFQVNMLVNYREAHSLQPSNYYDVSVVTKHD